MIEIRNQVALVTGGGTGLGRVISRQLANAGVHVAVNYAHSLGDAEETVQELASLGVKALAIQGDVSQARDVSQMVDTVLSQFGGIDILISNAGTTVFHDFSDLDAVSEDDWDQIMSVNVKATWLLAKAVAPVMNNRGQGRIVTISSVAGLRAQGSSLPYCVSKAALIHLTHVLAKALAPKILVNSVAPGLLNTRWSRGHSERTIQTFLQGSPLNMVPTLEDVANQVLTFVQSTTVTGQVAVVDAGVTL